MKTDFLVCTNSINYSIARALIGTGRLFNPLILLDLNRSDITPMEGVRQWQLSVSRWRLIRFLLSVPGVFSVNRVFIPHHRLNRRASVLIERAAQVEVIDDGMDTRRVQPRNIDVPALRTGQRYHTFIEYDEFPHWMGDLEVVRTASLTDAFPVTASVVEPISHRHVFVESPGLDVDFVVKMMDIDPADVVVVRHPSPPKRSAIIGPFKLIEGRRVGVDALLKGLTGERSVYFGETMSFFIGMANTIHLRHQCYLALTTERCHSLVGLPPMDAIFFDDRVVISRIRV